MAKVLQQQLNTLLRLRKQLGILQVHSQNKSAIGVNFLQKPVVLVSGHVDFRD